MGPPAGTRQTLASNSPVPAWMRSPVSSSLGGTDSQRQRLFKDQLVQHPPSTPDPTLTPTSGRELPAAFLSGCASGQTYQKSPPHFQLESAVRGCSHCDDFHLRGDTEQCASAPLTAALCLEAEACPPWPSRLPSEYSRDTLLHPLITILASSWTSSVCSQPTLSLGRRGWGVWRAPPCSRFWQLLLEGREHTTPFSVSPTGSRRAPVPWEGSGACRTERGA